jgi:hypothetical protein
MLEHFCESEIKGMVVLASFSGGASLSSAPLTWIFVFEISAAVSG